MQIFLEEFFPVGEERSQEAEMNNNYCRYVDQGMQIFTSSLFLTALISTFYASNTTRHRGRKTTMLIAGLLFLVGIILSASARSLPMLIVGRIFLGSGVGFANQVYS